MDKRRRQAPDLSGFRRRGSRGVRTRVARGSQEGTQGVARGFGSLAKGSPPSRTRVRTLIAGGRHPQRRGWIPSCAGVATPCVGVRTPGRRGRHPRAWGFPPSPPQVDTPAHGGPHPRARGSPPSCTCAFAHPPMRTPPQDPTPPHSPAPLATPVEPPVQSPRRPQ